jgi:hypothetical protein
MSKHRKDNPYKLVSHGENGLFVGDSFSHFVEEIFSEDLVIPCYLCSHEPENTPEVLVAPLGNSALPLEFPGLMDGGIKPSVSDKFFVVLKTAHIPNFGQEMESSDISDAFDGFEDLQVLEGTLPAHLGQHIGEPLQLFLQQKELGGLLGKDELSAGAHRGDRILRQRDQFLRGDLGFSSPSTWPEQLSYLRDRKGFDYPGRRVVFEEIKNSFGVDIGHLRELGKGDREQLLNVIFESGDLGGKPFPLPGQFAEIGREEARLWQGAIKHSQEAGDGEGIFLVSFGLPERELHEVRDKEGIDDDGMVAVVGEKGRKVDVIAAGGFHANEDKVLREFGEVFGEFPEALHIHGGGELKDFVLLSPYGMDSEGSFGDIQPDKDLIHEYTSIKDFLAGTGDASQPILHDDKSSQAQPTYHGCGRQGTDSSKGFLAQVKRSSPALPLLILMGKTHSHKTYTTNS